MKENSREEDIEIVENILHKGYTMSILHPNTNIKECEIKAIEHILSDYKRVLKENEKLNEYKENYIPVQKIKDRISERQFELQQEYKDFEDDAI